MWEKDLIFLLSEEKVVPYFMMKSVQLDCGDKL